MMRKFVMFNYFENDYWACRPALAVYADNSWIAAEKLVTAAETAYWKLPASRRVQYAESMVHTLEGMFVAFFENQTYTWIQAARIALLLEKCRDLGFSVPFLKKSLPDPAIPLVCLVKEAEEKLETPESLTAAFFNGWIERYALCMQMDLGMETAQECTIHMIRLDMVILRFQEFGFSSKITATAPTYYDWEYKKFGGWWSTSYKFKKEQQES